jgi:hypothetical protein
MVCFVVVKEHREFVVYDVYNDTTGLIYDATVINMVNMISVVTMLVIMVTALR